jgi:hypothetical protein
MQIIIAGYVSIWGGGRRWICVDMSIHVDMGWRKREDMCRYVSIWGGGRGGRGARWILCRALETYVDNSSFLHRNTNYKHILWNILHIMKHILWNIFHIMNTYYETFCILWNILHIIKHILWNILHIMNTYILWNIYYTYIKDTHIIHIYYETFCSKKRTHIIKKKNTYYQKKCAGARPGSRGAHRDLRGGGWWRRWAMVACAVAACGGGLRWRRRAVATAGAVAATGAVAGPAGREEARSEDGRRRRKEGRRWRRNLRRKAGWRRRDGGVGQPAGVNLFPRNFSLAVFAIWGRRGEEEGHTNICRGHRSRFVPPTGTNDPF